MAKTITDFFDYYETHNHDSMTDVMHGKTDNGEKYLVLVEKAADWTDEQVVTLEHLTKDGDVQEEVFREMSKSGFGDERLYEAAVEYHNENF